ncbi:MAG: class I lanthipeptide [Bacteroidota bacterium]
MKKRKKFNKLTLSKKTIGNLTSVQGGVPPTVDVGYCTTEPETTITEPDPTFDHTNDVGCGGATGGVDTQCWCNIYSVAIECAWWND